MKRFDLEIPEKLQQQLIEKADRLNITVESLILDSLERLIANNENVDRSLGKPIQTLEEIKSKISELKPFLQEQYNIIEIGIFGSYVKGLQNSASDVDILVEFAKTPSLLKISSLQIYLSDRLDVKVDLVRKKGLKQELKEKILTEVQYI
ncbi:MAG: nucleotidyltransferase family protein [Pseudanabaena sp.]|jgi:predicted nucleotidyltransferase